MTIRSEISSAIKAELQSLQGIAGGKADALEKSGPEDRGKRLTVTLICVVFLFNLAFVQMLFSIWHVGLSDMQFAAASASIVVVIALLMRN